MVRRRRCSLPVGVAPLLILTLAIIRVKVVVEGKPLSKSSPTARLPKQLELSSRRIIHEWKDVIRSGLHLDHCAVFGGPSTPTTTSEPEPIRLGPLRGNLYEWHFTIAGPPGTAFEGGLYHGRVLLPRDYPASAPTIQMLTPSGRFEVKADICLSATAFHQDSWQPVWTVRTLVSALQSHMATRAVEIGGIEASANRRRALAVRSRRWKCRICNCDHSHFPGKIFRNLPEPKGPAAGSKARTQQESVVSLEEKGSLRQIGLVIRGVLKGLGTLGLLLLFVYLNFGWP